MQLNSYMPSQPMHNILVTLQTMQASKHDALDNIPTDGLLGAQPAERDIHFMDVVGLFTISERVLGPVKTPPCQRCRTLTSLRKGEQLGTYSLSPSGTVFPFVIDPDCYLTFFLFLSVSRLLLNVEQEPCRAKDEHHSNNLHRTGLTLIGRCLVRNLYL